MNEINIQEMLTPYGYNETYWRIDGKCLPAYLNMWVAEMQDDYLHTCGEFNGLCPAWSKELDWYGDVRWMWQLIEMDNVVLPLLLCEDDLDFSCIVIVVEVEKTKDFVYWNRIGYVLHENENFEEEKKKGILYTASYSDRDWEKYGYDIAFEKVDSPMWKEWISNNWAEELYRRRMNYTLPYYQTDGNVCWIKNVDWVFDRIKYEQMVEDFRTIENLKLIQNFPENKKLNIDDWLIILSGLTSNGNQKLEEHIEIYKEVLVHVIASELITEPLIDLLKSPMDKEMEITLYCKMIELMWTNGISDLKNVVEVTILEKLSDEELVWQRFVAFISCEFKHDINEISIG